MIIAQKQILSPTEHSQVNKLWNEEFPSQLKDRFETLLIKITQCEHYLVKDGNDKVIAWAVKFDQDGETRFSLIVDSLHQRRGLGAALLTELKSNHSVLYGWVVDREDEVKADGKKYRSPLSFYLRNEFAVLPHIRIDNELINAVKIKWTRGG